MGQFYIQIAAIISATIFFGISIFQILISLGLPFGEAAWGGSYKVLPNKLRIASVISAIILMFAGLIFLQHGEVIFLERDFVSTKIVVWVFTIFLGLNTLGNLASKSKKEKMIMTPISGIALLSCLFIAVFS